MYRSENATQDDTLDNQLMATLFNFVGAPVARLKKNLDGSSAFCKQACMINFVVNNLVDGPIGFAGTYKIGNCLAEARLSGDLVNFKVGTGRGKEKM